MALAKDHRLDQNSAMCFNQSYTYYENVLGGLTIQDSSNKNLAMSNSSPLSSPSSSNSSGLGYQTLKYQSEEGNSVVNFKGGYGNFPHSSGSFLSFEQNEQFHQSSYSRMSNVPDDFSVWEDNIHHNYQVNSKSRNPTSPFLETPNNMQTAKITFQFGVEDLRKEQTSSNKRPYMEESTQPNKKQCTSPSKQTTSKSSPSKDPQSIAAKNRREKISERLKVLQELVPNGSKVDMVTMLEKAIGYVKFLQLQVKVLATDEFWPAQGGAKASPNLSQVKEAIDAIIIASQRDARS